MDSTLSPLELFHKGFDTLAIAKYLGLKEHEVYNQLSALRDARAIRVRRYRRDYMRRQREEIRTATAPLD
jgi:transcription initiation factor IIE alpha subunit